MVFISDIWLAIKIYTVKIRITRAQPHYWWALQALKSDLNWFYKKIILTFDKKIIKIVVNFIIKIIIYIVLVQ